MRKGLFIGMLIGALLLLAACGSSSGGKPSADVKAADDLALQYVQASVDGDDELFRKILSPEEPHYQILEKDEHTFPGRFKEIGKRYSIYRFEKEPTEKGELHYEVLYYLPNHNGNAKKWLEMKKEQGTWKIHELEAEEAEQKVENPKDGVYIHKYVKEGEG